MREKPTVAWGARVRITGLWQPLEAVVVEHRGFIGAGGREMVRIRALHDESCSQAFECAVEELEVVPPLHTALRARLTIGTRVLVRFPHGAVEAHVTDDRGLILQGDSQVVRVQAVDETYYLNEFDIPTDFLEVLPPEPRPRRRNRKRPSPG